MAGAEATFDAFFKQADRDGDGRISGQEAVDFSQGFSLPKHVLAQIWNCADQNKTGFLGRPEFYNFLRLVTVAQSGRALSPEIVNSALYGPAAAKIPAPQIKSALPSAQMTLVPAPRPQGNSVLLPSSQVGPNQMAGPGFRPPGNSVLTQPNPNLMGAVQMNPGVPTRPQGSYLLPPAAQIGAIQMNSAAPPIPQGNYLPPASKIGALQPAQYTAPRGQQTQPLNIGMNQQILSSSFVNPPPQGVPSATPVQALGINTALGGGNVSSQSVVSSGNIDPSSNWLGNKAGVPSVGGFSQPSLPASPAPSQQPDGFSFPIVSATGMAPRPESQANPISSLPPVKNDAVPPQDSKALVLAEYGSASSGIQNDPFSFSSQPNAGLPASTPANLSGLSSLNLGPQNSVKPGQVDVTQSTSAVTFGSSQVQDQLQKLQSSSAIPASAVPRSSGVAPVQWPKISQSDIQKYTKLFEDVDKDKDGKITGIQARTLFLSWRLPREVLKQIWDLSDQDNDGMLSLREFCMALYLMERHRSGTPLPESLPDSIRYDEVLLQAAGLPAAAYSGQVWQQNQVPTNRMAGVPVVPVMGVRPPLPRNLPSQGVSVTKPGQANSIIPSMDNHAKIQAGRDVQSTINMGEQGGDEAQKKVGDAEKLILDSTEKLEYYRSKMQDLVLYKSRCDNRLNEITERALADKQEVDSLAKKYEEKYKQVAELASKLAVEEAQFRDVQERKQELQNAIIKMDQGGSADGLLQVRADRIQYQLEELEKALIDRCRHFGFDLRPTTSLELPFGWEPGIQEGALDWDERWDKFDDEGFAVVKENGKISEEFVKKPSSWSRSGSFEETSPNGHVKDERLGESESANEQSEEESGRSPNSPGRSESHFGTSRFDVSEPNTENYSEYGGTETNIFADNYADEASWKFDDNDTESIWGAGSTDKDADRYKRYDSFFTSSSADFGINPVNVDSPGAGGMYGKKRNSLFDDSVPASPAFASGFSPKFNDNHEDSSYVFGRFDSFRTEDSGVFPQEQRFSRFDSVNSSRGETFARFDSVSSSGNSGHSRFDSFDDSDPFGSTGPFKASSDSHSPTKF